MVEIILDEPLIEHVSEYDAVIVGTNCYQSMRNGFQYEVVKKYPEVKKANDCTRYGDISKCGDIVECPVEGVTTFILAFISFGYNFKGDDSVWLDRDALEHSLGIIDRKYKGRKIATTVIGGTPFDGNADKGEIIETINRVFRNADVDVYDYKQMSSKELLSKERCLKLINKIRTKK